MKTLIKKASAFAIAGLASVGLMTTSPVTEAAGERIVFISHAPDSDSWWNTIKNAIKDASEHLGVTVEYRNPPSGDLTDMARIVEQAVASNPQGIVLSIADYDVLKGPVEKATRKLIPVITMNSGTHAQSEQLGALLHVGQPEYDAGFGAGKKAKEAGVTNFLCVNHYITNPASVERCQGFADALGIELGNQMIDSGSDPTDVEKKVAAYLRQNSNTQAVLTLGPTSAEPTLRAVDKMGLGGKIFFATFDLSEEIATGIKDGVINFAIDQQPYLQGYLPVMALTLYNRYGVIPANHINSGPGFITKDNIAMVETLAGEYR
ncbi:sugar ABC transporter substrate-binding protein [Balneatrix alpica]|uniref:Sugar ABC transporter substrate-binding protein n=1 Tax=Balneatrix alpica TaxID=75684 RepID=A0ABV5ZBV5_9GAMM|nr:sugar ABC transporter substrate-binding protein [Balneatrix alpica]